MDDYTQLKTLVQARLDAFLKQKRVAARDIGADLEPIFTEITAFLAGGKRFRAYYLYLGFCSVRALPLGADPHPDAAADSPAVPPHHHAWSRSWEREREQVVTAAVALELFHAAALVHDDIIDRSDTRRGRPATHRVFTDLHLENGWKGSEAHFGVSSAILIGDLLQSWADELFVSALWLSEEPRTAQAASAQFNHMRTEVAYGQYFDTLEEQLQRFAPHAEQLERATRILLLKSAKYSVEAPLLIGATLAGGGAELLQALSDYGLPAGSAFQLRDDVLGVFGDPEVTGKPSGDDLIEGKRTVLVTHARNALSGGHRRVFDDLLGTELTAQQIATLQQTIRSTGALDRVEELIAHNVRRAEQAARSPEIAAEAVEPLIALAARLSERSH